MRRKWLKRLVFTLIPAVLLFGGAELVLRAVDYRYSPWHLMAPVFEADGELLRVKPMFLSKKPFGYPFCAPQRLRRDKEPGTVRIALVGGSSVQELGRAKGLVVPLQQAWQRRVEIMNFGFRGAGSRRALASVQEAASYDVDLLVIYCGHNEFISHTNPATAPSESGWMSTLRGTPDVRLVQLAAQTYHRLSPPTTDALEARLRRYTAEQKETIYEQYQQNLTEIVGTARKHEIKVLLSTLAYSYEAQPQFAAPYENVERLERLSDVELLGLLKKHPDNAMVEYTLGMHSINRGETDQARQYFERSFLHDQTPIRAGTAINERVRQVAQSENVALVDMFETFHQRTGAGLPDKRLFADQVHFKAPGEEIFLNALADAILDSYEPP